MKPGRPRKNPENDPNEIEKNFDDWNTQINEIFEEQRVSSDGYSSNSSEGFVPTKKKIHRNSPRKTKPNKKRKTKENNDFEPNTLDGVQKIEEANLEEEKNADVNSSMLNRFKR